MAQAQPVKGRPWFSTPDAPGDRTLEQQLLGLENLWPEIEGKTVLDVGCAEGLISLECIRSGAGYLLGVDSRNMAVNYAIANGRNDPATNALNWQFGVADANVYAPDQRFDIVLMLAVLHKLKNPSEACRRIVTAARAGLVVIRLPPKHAPDIVDARSGGKIHHIGDVMFALGFDLERAATDGPFGEWVGYYRRTR